MLRGVVWCCGAACAGDEIIIIIMRACACCVYVSECKLGGWGYEEKRSDDAVEGGVGVKGWGGAVEEQGEGGRGLRTTLLREDSEGREGGVSVCG